MPAREVIVMSESPEVRARVEAILNRVPRGAEHVRGGPSWAAIELAKQLRIEQAVRERAEFGVKWSVPPQVGMEEDDDVVEEEEVSQVDYETERFLCPTVNEQLNEPGSSLTGQSIMRELFDNPIAPFVEGEPIGMIQNHKRGPAPALLTPAQIKEEERTALRARQRSNDRTLARLARRAK